MCTCSVMVMSFGVDGVPLRSSEAMLARTLWTAQSLNSDVLESCAVAPQQHQVGLRSCKNRSSARLL